jgi:hypothetical protein
MRTKPFEDDTKDEHAGSDGLPIVSEAQSEANCFSDGSAKLNDKNFGASSYRLEDEDSDDMDRDNHNHAGDKNGTAAIFLEVSLLLDEE